MVGVQQVRGEAAWGPGAGQAHGLQSSSTTSAAGMSHVLIWIKIAVKQGEFAQCLAFLLFSGVLLIKEISAHLVEYTLSKGRLKKGNCRIKYSNFQGP